MKTTKLQLFSALTMTLSALLSAACSVEQTTDAMEAEANLDITAESGDCKVVYKSSGWSGGFSADVSVTNKKGVALTGWTLEWDFPGDQKITSLWNGTPTQSGAHVSVKPAGWNSTLAAGATASVGFNGSGADAAPRNFKLSGASCGGATGGGSTGGGSTGGGSTGGGSTGGGTTGGGSTSGGTCAAFTAGKTYKAGDRVTNNGKTYECKPFPYSGWCGLGGAYTPGTGSNWQDAWSEVSGCSGGSTGGGSTGGGSTGGGSTGGGSTGGGSTGGGSTGGSNCNPPNWQAGTNYPAGARVKYNGLVYYAEHENPGYDPVISTWFWEPDAKCGSTGGGSTGGGSTGGGSTGGGSTGGGSTGGGTGFKNIVSEAMFNSMFPGRNPFYTYQGLVQATDTYPSFANISGSAENSKREAAAFLANMAHETGNLVYVEEIARGEYCGGGQYPCAPGKKYYGRGPIQLSWNYNYGAAGAALGLPLLQDPDLVARDSKVAWQTGLWFWMTQTGAGNRTAHTAMTQGLFGETIRTINGALECNGGNSGQVDSRVAAYQRFCGLLGVDPGSGLRC